VDAKSKKEKFDVSAIKYGIMQKSQLIKKIKQRVTLRYKINQNASSNFKERY
jgi:hypothetical protein